MRASPSIIGLMVACSLAARPSSAQVQEGQAACSSGVVTLCYGDHANCSLSAPSEIDLYRFHGNERDVVLLTLSGLTTALDPRFEVLDPTGILLFSNSCTSGCCSTCSVNGEFVLQMSGLHTILVSDVGANNTGSYSLNLERVGPSIPYRFVEYGVPLTVTLGHASDHDFLAIEGMRDDIVRVTVSGLTTALDPAFVLYDPDGDVVANGSCTSGCCSTCSVVSANLTLPLDGRYHLMVYDVGWNNTGNLSVTVSCLVGGCPPPLTLLGTNYCATNPNSTGNPAFMTAWGSEEAADGTLFLYASDVPKNTVGIFFFGATQASIPLGSGIRCVGAPVYRFAPVQSCNRGELRFAPDFGALPSGQQFLSGSTWNFQAWFRDGSDTNTSDGLSLTFL